jgi:hypothetical protein
VSSLPGFVHCDNRILPYDGAQPLCSPFRVISAFRYLHNVLVQVPLFLSPVRCLRRKNFIIASVLVDGLIYSAALGRLVSSHLVTISLTSKYTYINNVPTYYSIKAQHVRITTHRLPHPPYLPSQSFLSHTYTRLYRRTISPAEYNTK